MSKFIIVFIFVFILVASGSAENAIKKAQECSGGCDNNNFCAYASAYFSGPCARSSSCKTQCIKEDYANGYCAFSGPTCRRLGRSCWCTNRDPLPW